MHVHVHSMELLACDKTTLFGCQLSCFDPVCVATERGGGEGGAERLRPDLLSSVAVVRQGRPSLGNAHDQFFWRDTAERIC